MNARRNAALALLLVSGAALGDGDAVYQRSGDDGTVELTNIPDTAAEYRTVVGSPPPPPVAAGGNGAGTAPPPASEKPVPISQGPMGDTLRELYSGAHAAHQAAGH